MGKAAPRTTKAAPKLPMAEQATKNQPAQTSWTTSRATPARPSRFAKTRTRRSSTNFDSSVTGRWSHAVLAARNRSWSQVMSLKRSKSRIATMMTHVDAWCATKALFALRSMRNSSRSSHSNRKLASIQATARATTGAAPKSAAQKGTNASPTTDSGTKIACINKVAVACFCLSRLCAAKSGYRSPKDARNRDPRNASPRA
mmetsp:Transcript_16640/g.54193  ORF Transcript_16640/g.54193 Transcript_16640/m.54193 type:complete len:201 (+) Transcript_16640:401-1003(+)